MTRSLYIAGASSELERYEAFRDAAVAMGYRITFDWGANIRRVGAANGPLTEEIRKHAADQSVIGATECSTFVLLLPGLADLSLMGFAPRLERVHTIGAWYELGVSQMDNGWRAGAMRDYVSREFLVVGDNPERTIFTVGLPQVATDADALDYLRGLLKAVA